MHVESLQDCGRLLYKCFSYQQAKSKLVHRKTFQNKTNNKHRLCAAIILHISYTYVLQFELFNILRNKYPYSWRPSFPENLCLKAISGSMNGAISSEICNRLSMDRLERKKQRYQIQAAARKIADRENMILEGT